MKKIAYLIFAIIIMACSCFSCTPSPTAPDINPTATPVPTATSTPVPTIAPTVESTPTPSPTPVDPQISVHLIWTSGELCNGFDFETRQYSLTNELQTDIKNGTGSLAINTVYALNNAMIADMGKANYAQLTLTDAYNVNYSTSASYPGVMPIDTVLFVMTDSEIFIKMICVAIDFPNGLIFDYEILQ